MPSELGKKIQAVKQVIFWTTTLNIILVLVVVIITYSVLTK